ncbi:MAG: hypothetical protein ACKV0T_08530 [Planctomycetales bacterium]
MNRSTTSTTGRGMQGVSTREGHRSTLPVPDWLRFLSQFAERLSADQWTWLFVGLGVSLRLLRYLLVFPLWGDEYQLAANFLDRDFSDLLRPLDHNQVAPLGFLWIELAAVRWLGFSEWSLRLFPTLCGIGSVFLFRHVARRLLHGTSLVLAVAIFAVAYFPVRHSAEVKPYATDLFVSLALWTAAVAWWRARQAGEAPSGSPWKCTRWLWLLTGLAPLVMSVSFTAVFVAGGLSLGIAWTLWREPRAATSRSERWAWLAFNLAVAAAFFWMMRLNLSAQYEATRAEMTDCWADGFPPWRQPLSLIGWLAVVHTGEMFAYPIGAENGGSLFTSLLFLAGLAVFWRSERRGVAVAIFGMFGLSLAAAALQRYPYGSHARLSQYLAPAICLLTGAGVALACRQWQGGRWRNAGRGACLAGCALIGIGLAGRDLMRPYKLAPDRDHNDFARRFWNEAPDELTVCLRTDLQLATHVGSFDTAFRCYQRIHSPAHRNGAWEASSQVARADRPLRCVDFHSASVARNEALFADWMQSMLTRYELVRTESHQNPLSRNRNELYDYYLQCYDVYHFIPKTAGSPHPPEERMAAQPSSTH